MKDVKRVPQFQADCFIQPNYLIEPIYVENIFDRFPFVVESLNNQRSFPRDLESTLIATFQANPMIYSAEMHYMQAFCAFHANRLLNRLVSIWIFN